MLASALKIYRRSFTGLAPSSWYLALVMLINRSGTMVVPFMSMYLTQHQGMGLDKAGIIMALFGLGAVCGALLGGRLTDRTGFYTVQLASLAGGGIMFLVLGQMQGFVPIAICTFLLSLVNEAFRPANQTATAYYSLPENRTRSFSLNRLAVNLGWAFGGALGGFLAKHNYSLLFWVDGLTNLSAACLLWWLLPRPSSLWKKEEKKETNPEKAPSVYSDHAFLIFVLLTIFFAMCFFQLFATQPVFFKEVWKLDEVTIGWIMALNGLIIALFEMPLVNHFDRRVNNLHFIAAGVLLCGASFAILNLGMPGVFMALVSCVLVTTGEMLAMPFMNAFWVSRSKHANRGQYASLYTAAYSIAHVAGPFGGARLAHDYGYALLWWCTGLLCAVAALGYWWLDKNTKAL